MTEKTLVGLMGHQPAPLLLSVREQAPNHVIIIHTEDTERQARNLQALLKNGIEESKKDTKDGRTMAVSLAVEKEERSKIKVILAPSSPYNLRKAMQDIEEAIQQMPDEGEIIFDITGGTKIMSLAAALVAQQREAWALYIETAHTQGKLYQYDFSSSPYPEDDPSEDDPFIPLKKGFELKEYLALYLGNFTFETPSPKNSFEKVVYEALERSGHFNEILCSVKQGGALDIDIVVRCGIQVGIVEVKRTSQYKKKEDGEKNKELAPKKGIDQLNTAGGPKFLGTWVNKFYVVDEEWDDGKADLRALAKARDIKLIELPSFTESPPAISPEDKEKLVETIRQAMACK